MRGRAGNHPVFPLAGEPGQEDCMLFRKEIIPLDARYPFDVFPTSGVPAEQAVLHFHDCLEIDFVRSGAGTNIIESRRYAMRPGEFYAIK